MNCNNCGEKLNVTPGKSVNFCSNCGNKIVAKTTAEVIGSTDAALLYIVDNLGADELLGSKIVSCFGDITCNQLRDEKELIKILYDKGALECLKEALQKPVSEKEIAMKRALAKLPRFLQGSEEADIMLRRFAAALGWQLHKSQPASPPKSAQPHQAVNPQQTQNIILPDTSVKSNNVSVCPSVGSIIKFADIDWRVLTVENNKALLISEKILEKRPYNVDGKDITWENCTLRKYLNNEFYNSLDAAKSTISETRNDNPNNPWYGTAGGNTTTDKVFLLSLDELVKYFGESGDLRNKRCKDNKGNNDSTGGYLYDQYNSARVANYRNEGASFWWLRSPGEDSFTAACVGPVGDFRVSGVYFSADSGGIRPALWLNLPMI